MRNTLLPLLLILLSHHALANLTYSLDRGADGRLRLSAPSCTEAQTAVEALSAWKSGLGEAPAGSASAPKAAGERCSSDVTEILPAFVKERQGTETAFNGPNCWNTTLLTLGMAERIRFSSAGEMSFWMSSPYCRELGEGEKALPGDAIAIRSLDPDLLKPGETYSEKQAIEVHGMIFLTPDLAWSKNTSSHEDAYAVQRSDFIYSNFHVYSCVPAHGVNPQCFKWANYYRCRNPSADRENALAADAELKSVSGALTGVEASLSQAAAGGKSAQAPDTAALSAQLDKLEPRVQAALKAGKSPVLFFWKAAAEEILSLRTQIGIIEKQLARKR